MLPSPLPYTLIALLLSSPAFTAPLAYPANPLDERAGSAAANAWTETSDTWTSEVVAPASFISYWPSITIPDERTSWNEGEAVEVSWNGTTPPYAPNQISQTANLTLGYIDVNSPGYHLDIDNPLAIVNLYTAPYSVSITLPTNLTSRATYILVLGSTANVSPQFTIVGTGPEEIVETSTTGPSSRTLAPRPTTYVLGGITTVVGQPGTPTSSSSSSAATDQSTPSPFSDSGIFVSSSSGNVFAAGTTTITVASDATSAPESTPSSSAPEEGGASSTVTVTAAAASVSPSATGGASSIAGVGGWMVGAVAVLASMTLMV